MKSTQGTVWQLKMSPATDRNLFKTRNHNQWASTIITATPVTSLFREQRHLEIKSKLVSWESLLSVCDNYSTTFPVLSSVCVHHLPLNSLNCSHYTHLSMHRIFVFILLQLSWGIRVCGKWWTQMRFIKVNKTDYFNSELISHLWSNTYSTSHEFLPEFKKG